MIETYSEGVKFLKKRICDYGSCAKEATTKGFVLAKQEDNTHKTEPVFACDKHKKINGFFEEKKHEEIYREFWKGIVENDDGTLNIEQVKKELADYRILLKEVPKVYSELAGFSKPHTRADVIISAVNDRMIDKQIAYDDLTMTAEKGEVILSVERLKKYFDIK